MRKIANCFKLHANPQVFPGPHHEQEEKYKKTAPKKAFISPMFCNLLNTCLAAVSTPVLQPSALLGNRRPLFPKHLIPLFQHCFATLIPFWQPLNNRFPIISSLFSTLLCNPHPFLATVAPCFPIISFLFFKDVLQPSPLFGNRRTLVF
jgi:hypothetical protein